MAHQSFLIHHFDFIKNTNYFAHYINYIFKRFVKIFIYFTYALIFLSLDIPAPLKIKCSIPSTSILM